MEESSKFLINYNTICKILFFDDDGMWKILTENIINDKNNKILCKINLYQNSYESNQFHQIKLPFFDEYFFLSFEETDAVLSSGLTQTTSVLPTSKPVDTYPNIYIKKISGYYETAYSGSNSSKTSSASNMYNSQSNNDELSMARNRDRQRAAQNYNLNTSRG